MGPLYATQTRFPHGAVRRRRTKDAERGWRSNRTGNVSPADLYYGFNTQCNNGAAYRRAFSSVHAVDLSTLEAGDTTADGRFPQIHHVAVLFEDYRCTFTGFEDQWRVIYGIP